MKNTKKGTGRKAPRREMLLEGPHRRRSGIRRFFQQEKPVPGKSISRREAAAKRKIGVIIMTYGSATKAENTRQYMRNIYGDKASKELIEDFANRYRLVGGSPLVKITAQQASALQKKLGKKYFVRSGMQHSEPSIDNAVAACKKAGAPKIVGIILSPQFSSFIMEGYRIKLLDAALRHGYSEDDVAVAAPWPTEPHFVELLAKRVKDALKKLNKKYKKVAIVYTTHSLPERVVKSDPSYLKQLSETIKAVVKKLGKQTSPWYQGYQSAGHTPEVWLKPDLTDILDGLNKFTAGKMTNKVPAVLIVPIQFLADHLEILYDLDVAGKEQCDERHVAYNRIELPNTHRLFITSLATIAKQTQKEFARQRG